VNVPVGGERVEAGEHPRNSERFSFFSTRRLRARGNRDDVDEAKAADRVDMVCPDEPWTDEAHPYSTHGRSSVTRGPAA
jgi:hypothetical protein